jgi:hypothetical protein
MVVPAATVAGGLGISAWLIFLDYRRRYAAPTRRRGLGRATRLMNAGLGLVALSVGLRELAGTDQGWPAVICYLTALAGLALVAVRAAEMLADSLPDEEEKRRRKNAGR